MFTHQSLCMALLLLFWNPPTCYSEPQFLRSRGAANVAAVGMSNDYDDLIRCMWNGTTVDKCHQIHCVYCNSTLFNLCVTTEYAQNLNGKYFTCESEPGPAPAPTMAPAADDDAPPDDDPVIVDDDAPPTPEDDDAPAPDDDAPAPDDDWGNHDENRKYIDDLTKCAKLPRNKCGTPPSPPPPLEQEQESRNLILQKNDTLSCVWCSHDIEMGFCFSQEAAKNVDGGFYKCEFND